MEPISCGSYSIIVDALGHKCIVFPCKCRKKRGKNPEVRDAMDRNLKTKQAFEKLKSWGKEKKLRGEAKLAGLCICWQYDQASITGSPGYNKSMGKLERAWGGSYDPLMLLGGSRKERCSYIIPFWESTYTAEETSK